MKKIALIIFFIAFAGVLLSESLAMREMFMVAKPLLMISLLAYYWFAAGAGQRSGILMLALIFSLAGDVLMMKEGNFISGLVAFLIAHILYIFTYRQFTHEESENSLNGLQRVRLAFPIILAGSGLVVILLPVLGEMKIPVIIYATVITAMSITALLRLGRTSSASFWMVALGAVLFMVSDSVLAINKFLTPIASASLWIMSTYALAQFLIVRGLLKHSQQ